MTAKGGPTGEGLALNSPPQLSKHWKDSDREDFLDDFGSDPEDEARPRPPRAAPGQVR